MVNEFLLVLLMLGFLAVASNPSPYYAVFGLVLGAVVGALLLSMINMTFLSLLLMLIYLGGMMVVFAYCTALAADPHPEAWGGSAVLNYVVVYFLMVVFMLGFSGWLELKIFSVNMWGFESYILDWSGVSQLYEGGGWVLMLGGLVLLLILLVVLEVVRGRYGGALRAV